MIFKLVYELRYKKTALKGLWKMPPNQRQRMVAALQAVAEDSRRADLDVRPLTNRPGYRLRIGQWRAIYRVDEAEIVVLVLDIGARGDIYK